jgi:hypothetical protein
MANLFDSANALTTEPNEIHAGSLIQWKRADLSEDYPPASYDLIYTSRLSGGLAREFTITATNDGGVFLASMSGAVTGAQVAGDYFWQAEIQRKSDNARVLVATGQWKILPDLEQSGADPRTHAQIMLGKIQSLLEGRADKDVSSYSIQGRSLAKMGIMDLLQWRDYYRKEVAREQRDADIAAGKPSKTTMKVRFL